MAEEAQCTAPPGPVLVKVGGLGDSAGGPAGSGSSGWKWIGFTKCQVGRYPELMGVLGLWGCIMLYPNS